MKVVLLVLLALLATPVAVVFQAKMESSAYNRLTGAHTTWFDALWVELRVQDSPVDSQR
jgi:ABC-type spermidine/putrescine transport system permease subunit II